MEGEEKVTERRAVGRGDSRLISVWEVGSEGRLSERE